MAEKYELAEQDYKAGMKYKDIAEKYGVSLNTVKSWKTRKWGKDDDEKSVHTKSESVHTKKDATKSLSDGVVVAGEGDDLSLAENGDLTDKQWLFCMYYTKYWNATKAYQKAYDAPYNQGRANGSRLIANDSVRAEIERMKTEIANGIMIDARAVLQKYIDVAFADIGDYVEFEGHAIRMKDLSEVDTSIIAEASNTEDGIKFKLADKMKALDFLAKYTDLLDENELKQLRKEQVRANTEKTRADMNKEVLAPLEITIKGVGEDDN